MKRCEPQLRLHFPTTNWRSAAARLVLRAKIVLAAAAGKQNKIIAEELKN
jgi:DNA-binding NarL/FixJ family response regulator